MSGFILTRTSTSAEANEELPAKRSEGEDKEDILSTYRNRHMAVGQNQWYHFGEVHHPF